MKLQCKNCLPAEGIEIPALNPSEKLKLKALALSSPLHAVTYMLNNLPVTHTEAKFLVQHINKRYGQCNRCNFSNLDREYMNCPKCGALNCNWPD